MKPGSKILIICLLVLLGRLSLFTEPYAISVDESTYLAMAEVLHEDGVIYKDVVDRKPPALIWFYQGVGELFGEWNLIAVQWVFVGLIFLLCFLAFKLASELYQSRNAGWIAAILFAAFSSCFPRGILAANAETPMTLCLAFSFLLLLKARGAKAWMLVFLSVFIAGIATLFKQYAGIIYAVFYLTWVSVSWRERNWILKNIVYAGVAVMALVMVYLPLSFYFYTQAALDEFVHYFLFDGLQYISSSREVVNNDTSWTTALLGSLVVWSPILVALALKKSYGRSEILGFLLFLGSLSTVFLSGRYYTHYFFPAIWAVCVWGSSAWESVLQSRPKWARALHAASVSVFIFFVFFNLERDRFRSWAFSRPEQEKIKQVADWVQSSTLKDERISVWGMASQIYVLSERGSGTRFVFADFVSGRQPGLKSSVAAPVPGKEAEYVRDLQEHKVRLIIDTSGAGINDYQHFPISRSKEVFQYVESHYRIREVVAGMEIWERVDS